PAVAIGVVAFAERDDLPLKIRKLFQDFFGKRTVLLLLELTAFDVDIDLDAECLLTVLFVRDADGRERNELTHDLRRFFAVAPEVLSIVVVAGNRDAFRFRRACRLERKLRSRRADRWGDTADVEPVRAVENLVEVEVSRRRH